VSILEREIVIVGLGSIGRRHLRNLRALGWTHVRLVRSGRATLSDDALEGWPVERHLDDALARGPVAVIVANPTAAHLPTALAAARAGAHLLIEKPIAAALDGLDELAAVVAERRLVALVGFQFRFHPALQQLRQWVCEGALGDIVSAQAHWGESLPDMHPWEDYRQGYAARAELGGGVLLTLCHPFDYLRWLLGDIVEVSAISGGPDHLGLSVDTTADVALRFASGTSAHVHLDFVRRPPLHRLELIGTTGTATWSQDDHVARRYDTATGDWVKAPLPAGFERNDLFLAEMRHFLACLDGAERPRCTLRDGRAALEVALAARASLRRSAS